MSVLLVERDDTLKILRMNRPHRANSLSADLVAALTEAIDESCVDGTRTLVFEGAGDTFCSGFDLSELENLNDAQVAVRVLDIEKLLQVINHAPFLTVALVQSRAFGAGADMVCACHRRIAEPHSQFCMPGLNFGIVLGTRRLAHRIGSDDARNLLINTRVFDAAEALELGFLTHIATRETWSEHVEQAKRDGAAVSTEHVARMLNIVIPDTREQDMADLSDSIQVPGLVDRIIDYKNSMRARAGKTGR